MVAKIGGKQLTRLKSGIRPLQTFTPTYLTTTGPARGNLQRLEELGAAGADSVTIELFFTCPCRSCVFRIR